MRRRWWYQVLSHSNNTRQTSPAGWVIVTPNIIRKTGTIVRVWNVVRNLQRAVSPWVRKRSGYRVDWEQIVITIICSSQLTTTTKPKSNVTVLSATWNHERWSTAHSQKITYSCGYSLRTNLTCKTNMHTLLLTLIYIYIYIYIYYYRHDLKRWTLNEHKIVTHARLAPRVCVCAYV